jgi:hypothetical protein
MREVPGLTNALEYPHAELISAIFHQLFELLQCFQSVQISAGSCA